MKEFENRLAVITGGGSGMGRELAVQLAQAGCHLARCTRLFSRVGERIPVWNIGRCW